MKVSVPKEVSDLASRIAEAQCDMQSTLHNLARAEQAVTNAAEIAAQIEVVSRKRALAFVSGTPADLATLDRQKTELESANRSALEDGAAAATAVTLLTHQLVEQRNAIAGLEGECRTLAMEWLAGFREKAIDRYIAVLNSIGPILAEALAADRVRHALGFHGESTAVHFMKAMGVRKALPVPHARLVDRPGLPYGIVVKDKPVTWLRAESLGDREFAQLLAELRSAGVFSDSANVSDTAFQG